MQAFLHFSSSKSALPFESFVKDVAAQTGGHDLHILSRSEIIGQAAFFKINEPVDSERYRAAGDAVGIDVNLLHSAPHVKKLMLCDMDSTIITSESLDHIAELAGISEAVKPITARAMAGEIDFSQALIERLAMLKGAPASLLDDIVRNTHLFDGARELVATMRAQDATCLLVSGGFTFLTQHIKETLDFHAHYANELAVTGDQLDGYTKPPILDSSAKVRILNEYCERLGLTHQDAICMGDGANDIPMLQTAGLGIAWQGKPLVRETITTQLNHSSLCGALFLQGISETDIK